MPIEYSVVADLMLEPPLFQPEIKGWNRLEGRPRNVDFERPLRADSRFGGHFVQGHVDAIGHVEEIHADADFHWITVSFPRHLAPYVIHKGSIAVDGISLTIARLGLEKFDIQIVPFTMGHTNLSRARVQDVVNLECDMVGKYVIRAAELAGLNFSTVPSGEVTH